MPESIELQVSLGLQQAMTQADKLREKLQQSVKPDSSAYKEIETLLNKVTRQAELFQHTKDEALKTSSGTKTFTNNLQKTFDLLAVATDKLKGVKGKDLIVSQKDAQTLQQMEAQLNKMAARITDLKAGKIGTFFDNSAIAQFKQIQEYAQKTGKDLHSMTFDDLQKAINEALTKTNRDLDDTTQKIRVLESVLKNVNVTDINKLTANLKTKTANSAVNVFKSENLQQARQQLAAFYNSDEYKLYSGQMKGNFGTGTSVQDAIASETKEIERTINGEIDKLNALAAKLSTAKAELRTVKVGTKGQTKADKSAIITKNQSILEEIGFDKLIDGENLDSYASKAAKAIEIFLQNIPIRQEAFDQLRQNMLNGLQHVFDNLDTNQVVNGVRNFRQSISDALSAQGIDVKDSGIAQALNSIKNGEEVEAVYQRMAAAVQTYTQSARASYDALNTQATGLQTQKSDLEQLIQTTLKGKSANQQLLDTLIKRYPQAEQAIRDFLAALQRVHQGNVDLGADADKTSNQYNQLLHDLQAYTNGLKQLETRQKTLGNVQSTIAGWMSFNQVLNLTRQAVQSMKNHIQELDKVMTQIAVVTNMTQQDLWGQIQSYSQIARQYGVAIKGVYEVSQIFYQQGLNTNDVMSLTTETLKMARIAGLDYATAADYMTTAVRGFKLEMSEANHVTDVWSALAARTASDTGELAVAISKTASSAEAVGSSFEATSAMIATMVSVTRESATNIGTALKSVISRYGEMTSDPAKLVDSEGEEMSLNRVDKALQTIGISIHDVNGQFRDFDDVIYELAEKWGTLDSLSQRYIATLMAGNRQQSRFLALVSNFDEYKNALNIALNSEDASEVQTIKTLESIEAKIEQMKVTIQEFYTSSGLEELYKGILEVITNVVSALNKMPKLFGKIPVIAVTIGMQVIGAIKNVLSLIVQAFATSLKQIETKMTNMQNDNNRTIGWQNAGRRDGKAYAKGFEEGQNDANIGEIATQKASGAKGGFLNGKISGALSVAASLAGGALTTIGSTKYGASTSPTEDHWAGGLTIAGGAFSGFSGALTGAKMGSALGPYGTAIGGIIGALASGLPGIIAGINELNVTTERQLELNKKNIEQAHQKAVLSKGEANDLRTSLEQLKQLEEAQYTSNEAMEEYITYRNQVAEQFPELVSGYDGEYNAIIDLAGGYEILADKIGIALENEEKERQERESDAKYRAQEAQAYETSFDKNSGLYNRDVFGVYRKQYSLNREEMLAIKNPGKLATSLMATMTRSGAFSGLYDKFGAQEAQQLYEAGEYEAALEALIELDKVIREQGEEYNNLLLEQSTTATHLSSTKNAIYDTIEDSEQKVLFYYNKVLENNINNIITWLESQDGYDSETNQVNGENFVDVAARIGQEVVDLYYNALEDEQKEFDKVLGNRDLYSSDAAFQDALEELFDGSLSDQFIAAQVAAYNNNKEKIYERFNKFVEKNSDLQNLEQLKIYFDTTDGSLPSGLIDTVTKNFKTFKQYMEGGLINYSQSLNDAFVDILEPLSNLQELDLQEVSSIFQSLDWFDVEAVKNVVAKLKEDERYKTDENFAKVVDELEEYQNTLYYSIDAATETYLKQVKTRQEQIDKIYKARTSGITDADNLSEITQLLRANGYEGNLSEAFAYENGQFVLTAEAYSAARQGLTKTLEQDRVELENRVQAYEVLLREINPSLAFDTNKYNSAQFKSLLARYGATLDDEQKALIDNLVGTQELTVQEFIDLLSQTSQDAKDQLDLSNIIQAEQYRTKMTDAFQTYISDISNAVNQQSFIDNAIEYYQQLNYNNIQMAEAVNASLQAAQAGGEEAVAELRKLAKRPLTRDEIEKAYHSQSQALVDAMDELLAQPGDIIGETAAKLIEFGEGEVKDLGDGQFLVIQTATNLYDAYTKLYADLVQTGEATIGDLNKVAARAFENNNNEASIIDALGDAASLTYTRFGEILAAEGKLFGDYINQSYIEHIGGGKMRITDFTAFAADMGWNSNSEEYISAFKTYNDSLVSLNRQAERNIIEELGKVATAKPGDQVNLTQFYSTLTEEAYNQLANSLAAYGAFLENGILTIHDDANLLAVNSILIKKAQETVDLTEAELLQLQETLENFFTSLIEVISRGVTGKLSKIEAVDLQTQAANYGLTTQLNFTETAEGLKLSRDSATQLYVELSRIDRIKASLLFDDIAKSFQEAGEECENISSTLAAIARLEADLQKPENENNQLLKDRLTLYKQIAQQQTSDPNQFKFMDRDLPNGMQGPENYWNAVGEAYTAMNQAKSTGYMEIQDYYNIINEMANLMEMSGGQLEWMGMNFENAAEMSAKLIEQGMSALTNIDGKGVKISMAKLGADFGIGVDDMAKGFDDGIKEMARSQIKMLDAQIALLEAVVAMEGLGDIDVDNIEGFSFGDVFNVDKNGEYIGGFTEAYKKWAKDIIAASENNEDLKKALEGISFNDTTLKEMLSDGTLTSEMTKEEAEQYFAAMNSLYQMFLSGEYDLQDLLPSIMRVAEASHFEGEITIGDEKIYITQGTVLEFDKENSTWKTPDGKEFKDPKDATDYISLMKLTGTEKGITEITNEKGEVIGYKSTLIVGSAEINVQSNNEGIQYLDSAGEPHDTLDKAIDANWALYNQTFQQTSDEEQQLTREAWEIQQGYKVVLTPEETTAVTAEQAEALKQTTWEEFKAEWDRSKGNEAETYKLEAKYGIKWTETNTEEDFNKLRELATGVEHKDIELNVTVTSDNEEFVNILNSAPATKDIVLNVTDINYNGLNTDPNNPNPNTPTINLNGATEGLESIRSMINEITEIDWTNFNTLSDTLLPKIVEQVEKIKTAVDTFANQTFTVELNQTGTGTVNIDSTTDTSSIFDLVSTLDAAAQGVIEDIQKVVDALSTMETTANQLDKLSKALQDIADTRVKLITVTSALNLFVTKIDNIRRSLDRLPSGTKNLAVRFNYSTAKSSAKGNVALTKGTEQPALAKGITTLMGELGPELVVSRGHYYVVGQSGAEFVNLDKDAIVFNHKQTKRLLQNGSISGRGKPFTNETNALAFAKGKYGLMGPAAPEPKKNDFLVNPADPNSSSTSNPNSNYGKPQTTAKTIQERISNVRVSPTSHTLQLLSYAKGSMYGPAMASAQAALAQLKQIRAMWQSMLDASAKELGSLAGGSGGKKGGGGGNDWQEKTTTAEIQRWYNLIRQIAKLEEDITYQETLQSKLESDRIANGKAMYKSYKQELALLQQEIGANQELAALQKSWYDAKRADLAASDYGKIFTYDENGLQQYVGSGAPGTGLGLDILENLTRQDVYGQAIDNAATARQQLAYLRSVGFNTENLRYNEDGTLIQFESLEGEELDNAYVQMMENFWSQLDGWRDELDSIYDSYHEQLEKVLSNQGKQNEIFQKIVENQLSVENDVLEALEAREQKRIDDAQDERDALSESADKFLNGLNDQLNKEREMYQRNNDQDDLNKLRRQLAILQRSGGAASQIRSLQDQINSKTQDAYFSAQQDQINAIKEASDAQLERLDAQIDLMTETLEYQKENGLLWTEVYEVMARTPAEIQDFITNNTPDFQSNSALQVAEDIRDLKLRIEQWTEYRDDVNSGNNPMEKYSNTWDTFYNSQKTLFGDIDSSTLAQARAAYESTLATTSDPNAAAQAADQILNQYRKVNPLDISNMANSGRPTAGTNNASSSGGASAIEKVSTIEGTLKNGSKGDDVRKLQAALNKLGYTDGRGKTLDEDGIFGSNTKAALEKFQRDMGIAADGILGSETKAKFALKGYSEGGVVDYTGLAMVHGSSKEPEGMLNASQMKLWKQELMMREQLLPSLLSIYKDITGNTFKGLTTDNSSNGMTIEHLEMNLNVAELKNDYDARRAAETMMEHLMDLSRKSGNIGIKRR